MKRQVMFAALLWLARGVASAGVGVWTLSPGSSDSPVVVGPDGAIYQGCGEFACKSVDHGTTWRPLAGPLADFGYPFTNVLAIDPAGAIYAAAVTGGEGQIVTFVEVSSDGGNTWTSLMPELFGTNLARLSIDPFSSATLFLLTGFVNLVHDVPYDGRLNRSTDRGDHWSEIDQVLVGIGTGSVTALALDPQVSGRLYAGTAAVDFPSGVSAPGLSKSLDGGATWTRSAANLSGALVTLVVDPFQSAVLYGGGPSGIVRSNDGGSTFVAASGLSTTQIVPDPIHRGRLYASTVGSGVIASSDEGATWTPMSTGLTDLTVDALTLDAAGGYLYAATPSGVFVDRVPNPETLELNAAHPFAVTLSATDQRTGRMGSGVATQVNDLWGWFSIPAITGNSNNPEVFVKLLDGTAINGDYWFFYGGLTDLEYTLTVKDDTTGATKTYTKPAGSECGGSDTAAFTP